MTSLPRWFWGIVGLVLCAGPASAETVRIDPRYSEQVNGYGEVQRVFGGTVNGTSRDQVIDEVRALHLNSARAYLWALNGYQAPDFVPPPLTPWRSRQYGGTPVSREESLAQWDRFYQQDFQTLMEAWWSKSFPRVDQLCQMALFERWGVTGGIVLHTELDGSADRHPEDVNRYYQAYWDTIHRHFPSLPIDFIQFNNEPGYTHWSGQFATQKEASETFVRDFNRLDAYFQERIPGTRLLGPCLDSVSFFSLVGWKNWTVPVLQGFRQVDYFNYHCYDIEAGPHLAWLEMLQAAGETLRGVRPRGVITETNFKLGDTRQEERFRWESEQLFMALANPDKLALRTYFLLAARIAHGGDVIDLFYDKNGQMAPTDVYWLYWVLADTRGRMLWTPPTRPEIKVRAASPDPDRLVISVLNDGEEPASVTLDPGLGGVSVKKVTKRYAGYQDGQQTHNEAELGNAPKTLVVDLPPGGVCSVRWELAQPLPSPEKELAQTEFFCHQTALPIQDGQEVGIDANALPTPDTAAFLRLGITTDDALFAKELSFTFNGRLRKVVWSELPQQIRAGFANTWWVEVPLEPGTVQAHNQLAFRNPDAAYRLMFASISYRQFPSQAALEAWSQETGRQRRESVSASLRMPGRLLGGSRVPIEWSIRNEGDQPRSYSVGIELPPGIALSGADLAGEVIVAAGAVRKFNGFLDVAPAAGVQAAQVKVSLQSKGGGARTLTQNVYIYPQFQAVRFEKPPALDGDPKEWEGVPEVSYKAPGLATRTRLAWDAENLYAFISVEGAFRPAAPDSLDNFWTKDAIEFCLDLENKKGTTYDANAFQLFFCPVGLDGQAPFGGMILREIRDDSVAVTGTRAMPGFRAASVTRSEGGYQLECAIPWAALKPGFAPQAGKAVGLDISLDHMKGSDGLSVSSSILGAQGKPFQRPDQWGVLTLLPKPSSPAGAP